MRCGDVGGWNCLQYGDLEGRANFLDSLNNLCSEFLRNSAYQKKSVPCLIPSAYQKSVPCLIPLCVHAGTIPGY